MQSRLAHLTLAGAESRLPAAQLRMTSEMDHDPVADDEISDRDAASTSGTMEHQVEDFSSPISRMLHELSKR